MDADFDALLNRSAKIFKPTFADDGQGGTTKVYVFFREYPCRPVASGLVSGMEIHEVSVPGNVLRGSVTFFFGRNVDVAYGDRIMYDGVMFDAFSISTEPGGERHHVEVTGMRVS